MNRPPPRSPLFPSPPLFRSQPAGHAGVGEHDVDAAQHLGRLDGLVDRKSTRLNSSHSSPPFTFVFFFNEPPPPEISPLSLPAALPISARRTRRRWRT